MNRIRRLDFFITVDMLKESLKDLINKNRLDEGYKQLFSRSFVVRQSLFKIFE